MSGFKDGGQVIVPVLLEFTGIYTEKHVIVLADHRQKAVVNHIPNLSNR